MNTIAKIVRLLTSWAWQREIGICDGLVRITEFHGDERGLEVHVEQNPEMAKFVAKCFASMVASSKNYTELRFDLTPEWRGSHEWITVLVKKGSGKTPHQLRQ